jgi:hypothetical protein
MTLAVPLLMMITLLLEMELLLTLFLNNGPSPWELTDIKTNE